MAEDSERHRCAEPGCRSDASFWLYGPDVDRWRPICDRHARHVHPSLEVQAWLESGYMSPVELGRPDGPPGQPEHRRAAAFRAAIEDVLDGDG